MRGPRTAGRVTYACTVRLEPFRGEMSRLAAAQSDHTLGFTSLEHETEVEELEISGEVPAWLGGSLLRTGPARFEVGEQRMRHWFDGLAMLHRFTIQDGCVSYANRFLQSRAYRACHEHGRIAYSEFATDPCRSLFKRVQTLFAPSISDNANVNVARLGERFVSMTETPLPVEFDPFTLATAEVEPYQAPGQLSTAHPHMDRAREGMLNYAAQLGRRSSYRFFTLPPGAREPRVIASLPTSAPAYVHSFGLTERWLVLVEFPFVVNPLALALSGRPYIENFRWRPKLGTRFTLVERSSGEALAGFQTEACFAFHHINSYEEDGGVVVDLCAYENPDVVADLYLERLRAGKPIATATPTRFRLDLETRSVARKPLADSDLELPRINYGRCNERPYRYVWGNAVGPSGFLERIVRVDVEQGLTHTWSAPSCYAGEPVFVAHPFAQSEDHGALLSVVLDAERQSSMLLVLDARDLSELARAALPHHIPFGFHGMFTRR
jgi:beta,beta-carotene 9',10'-dioxygenase